jgi:uncharacterized protein YprB with RNaseH-like and TPR domain
LDDPQMYFDYLRSGMPGDEERLYHNAMDVVSLAALFNMSPTCLQTVQRSHLHIIDQASINGCSKTWKIMN